MMQIMLVVHQFDEAHIGGTERYTLNLARGLVSLGHQVVVLTFDSADSTDEADTLAGREVSGILTLTLRAAMRDLPDPVRESYTGTRLLSLLGRALDQFKPDIVHITHPGNLGLGLVDLCEERSIPIVATLTDYWAVCPNSQLVRIDGSMCPGPVDLGQCVRCVTHMGPRGGAWRGWSERIPGFAWRMMQRLSHTLIGKKLPALRWLLSLEDRPEYIRQQLSKVDRIFCPGAFQRGVLIDDGLDAYLLMHAPHGIVVPASLAGKRQPSDEMRFAYIGPLAAHKGANLPVAALRQLGTRSKVSLQYWGSIADTEYSKQVQAAIAADDRVQHRGQFSYGQVADVLSGLDVLIMPSIWYENTPTILYEAFAAGVPVIASDLGGMRELVHAHDGGWLFEPGSVSALADCMSQLVNHPEMLGTAVGRIKPVPDFSDHLALVLDAYRTSVRS